jgi:hypothetical protein
MRGESMSHSCEAAVELWEQSPIERKIFVEMIHFG